MRKLSIKVSVKDDDANEVESAVAKASASR